MMETKPIGLYVHIPFCKRKCNYCDFCSVAANSELETEYIQSLIAEIESYRKEEKIKINTIFIGGGTPSLLSEELFKKIVLAIKKTFDISYDFEFTVEVNPGTITKEKIALYKSCGVNRISLGLQSIHEKEMKTLGRIHTFEEFEEAYFMIKDGLTDNINIDLMYGIPAQTKETFEKTLHTVIRLSPAHISAYGLIIEEGTPFFENKDSLPFPTEDEECDMYYMAHNILSEHGYMHYEISNYARVGMECRHNLKYWHDEEYIGVGIAAHSYYRSKRYSNTEEFSEYFSDPCAKYISEDEFKITKDPFEYAMLSLRLSEGFSLLEYKNLFGTDFTKGKENLIKLYTEEGFITIKNDRISLTPKGFYLSNTIMSNLIDFTT